MSSLDKIASKSYGATLLSISDTECELYLPKNVFEDFPAELIRFSSQKDLLVKTVKDRKFELEIPEEYHHFILRLIVGTLISARGIGRKNLNVYNVKGDAISEIDWMATDKSKELVKRFKSSTKEEQNKLLNEYDFLNKM